ncbi:MAG: SDR family NAD(P)-dependent oxidoreductase, partial [Promethearchaeota archaeon]
MGRFDGKIVLIGGNLGKIKKGKFVIGLGGAIAKHLLDEGAQIIVIDLDENISKQCENVIDGIKAMHCDLLKDRTYTTRDIIDDRGRLKIEVDWINNPALDMVKEIVKKYGKLDILITNFDQFKQGKAENCTEEMYDELRNNNIWPLFHLLAAVREQFKKQHEDTGAFAKVVMITSITGRAGLSMGALYSAFKGSIVGLTKSLAREFSRFANVNTVAIGPLAIKRMQGPKDRIISDYITTQTEMANTPLTFEKITPLTTFLA